MDVIIVLEDITIISNNLPQAMALKFSITSKQMIYLVLRPFRIIKDKDANVENHKDKAVNADNHTPLKTMEEKFVKNATIKAVFVINANAMIKKLTMVPKFFPKVHHASVETVNNAKIRLDVLAQNNNKDVKTRVSHLIYR